MKNILYIHGLGSSAMGGRTSNFLLDKLKEDKVYSFDVPIEPIKAISFLESKIKELKIDVLVGTSLGGFYVGLLKAPKKILINPCLTPSIEIPKLSPIGKSMPYFSKREDGVNTYIITSEIVEEYKKLENIYLKNLKENKDMEILKSYFILGLNDKTFSYKEFIEENYLKSHIFLCDSKHRLSNEDLENVLLPLI